MKVGHIRPRFVEFIPDHLEEGILYISQRYRTCSHLCCCGCGEEVVTPLSSAEWSVKREGDAVSLWPSIGNWEYACRSHYVIRQNRVLWADQMTAKQIERVQRRDAADLAKMTAIANALKRGGVHAEANSATVRPQGNNASGSAASDNKKSADVLVKLANWIRAIWRRN
jgi:hypothetical protein